MDKETESIRQILKKHAKSYGDDGRYEPSWFVVNAMKEMAEIEREACAKACENNDGSWADTDWNNAVKHCADKIRARSNV